MTLGALALIGGGEWTAGCDFDAGLLERARTDEVVILPTAAAYEHPERSVEQAAAWFAALGAKATGLRVLTRPDAEDVANAEAVRRARFVYIGGGSPLHLRSVLKASAVWQALTEAWHDGAVVAASSAGAMVLCDPMVDPRGGAFTVGLGLVEQLAVIPHADSWSEEKAHRTLQMAPAGLPVVALDERTALLRDPGGGWTVDGAGSAVVYVDGRDAGVDALSRPR